MNDPALAAWVARVLGVAVGASGDTQAAASSASSARGQAARAENIRGIAYPMLLLRWREAQQRALSAVAQLGQTILGLPEVKADPRFSSAQRAVTLLPSLMPQLGDTLADLLDRGINAGTDAGIAEEAHAVVARYRAQLAGAATLGRLETFARAHVGELAVVSTLDGCLAEIGEALAKPAPALAAAD